MPKEGDRRTSPKGSRQEFRNSRWHNIDDEPQRANRGSSKEEEFKSHQAPIDDFNPPPNGFSNKEMENIMQNALEKHDVINKISSPSHGFVNLHFDDGSILSVSEMDDGLHHMIITNDDGKTVAEKLISEHNLEDSIDQHSHRVDDDMKKKYENEKGDPFDAPFYFSPMMGGAAMGASRRRSRFDEASERVTRINDPITRKITEWFRKYLLPR